MKKVLSQTPRRQFDANVLSKKNAGPAPFDNVFGLESRSLLYLSHDRLSITTLHIHGVD